MRRQVRLTEDFLDQLDAGLPAERTGGLPSRRDFEIRDLLRIVDLFAEHWDTLTPSYVGRTTYREWSGASDLGLGLVVWVQGQLAADGAVELISLDIDVAPPWMSEEVDDGAEG